MASGLRERVPTALALAATVVAILLWTPPAVAVTVIALIMLAGAWEWAGLAGLDTPLKRGGYVLAVAGGIALDWWYTAGDAERVVFLRATALWWLLAFLWLVFAAQRGGRLAASIVGWIVLATAAVSLARLVLVEPQGRELLLFLLVLIAAADVGAYFGGRKFGRHRLAPRISPGKTWEGFAAGMLAASAAAALGAVYFGISLLPWLALCVLVALVSVVGDLVESMFKRRAGLKDSGSLLPGHGGVLDRIDSVTAAAPVYLLGLLVLGVA